MPFAGAPADSRANFEMIVNLAIKHDPVARLRVVHRLMSRRTQIEDCQACVRDRGNTVGFALRGKDLVAVVVGSAVLDAHDHATDGGLRFLGGLRSRKDQSSDTAHSSTDPRFVCSLLASISSTQVSPLLLS